MRRCLRLLGSFSDIAHVLFDLTKKDKVFVWGIAEEEAFVGMKKSIMSSPVLHLAADDQPFRVMSDGSGVATGAVIKQLSAKDGKYHPIAFQSKSLSPVKHNYEIHDVEMLAIIRALEEWRHYLEGAVRATLSLEVD